MNDLEKSLNEMNNEINQIEIPDELEEKLRQGLESVPRIKKKGFDYKRLVGVAVVLIFFIDYNAEAIAYYGKKILGYDGAMNNTLKELNEVGEGQIIDKTYVLDNGTAVTLDAIMLDINNIVLFYTVNNPNLDESIEHLDIELEGKWGRYAGGGEGETSADGKTTKWVMTYEAPNLLEKNMSLIISSETTEEEGRIDFNLDREQAMTKSLSVSVNKEIQISNRMMIIETIEASPINTVITGVIKDILEQDNDEKIGEKFFQEDLELELLADGKVVALYSTELDGGNAGSEFKVIFDALEKDIKKIELKLRRLSINETVNEEVRLKKDQVDRTIDVAGRDIIINNVYEENKSTYISITSMDDIVLDNFYLILDGKKVGLEQRIDEGYEQLYNDNFPRALVTRSFEFKGTGEELELVIKKIRFQKDFDQVLYSEKIK